MNHEHEQLKMNVRVFTDVLRAYHFTEPTKGLINALMSTDAFKHMELLSRDNTKRLNDDGEFDPRLDTEVKQDKSEWEVNNER